MKPGRLAISTAAVAVAAVATFVPRAGVSAAVPSSALSATANGHAVHFVLPGHVKGASGAAASSNNLQYSGGPVEASGSTNYAIFWEPSLTASVNSVTPTYNSLITRFLQDIGGTGLYGVATQYYQTTGGTTQNIANSSTFGGSYVDTSIYPGPVLTNLEIQGEVTKAMQAQGWTGGIGHEFFVFTAKNEISCAGAECSNAVFCAYHSSFTSGSQEILYANQPYTGTAPVGCNTPTSPNGDLDADSTINVVSHELMETVTDPSVGDSNYAWIELVGLRDRRQVQLRLRRDRCLGRRPGRQRSSVHRSAGVEQPRRRVLDVLARLRRDEGKREGTAPLLQPRRRRRRGWTGRICAATGSRSRCRW